MIDSQIDGIRERLLTRKTYLLSLTEKAISAAETLRLLEQIETALGRIHDGTYGICEVCGVEIEEDRLKANPLIRVCLEDFNAEQQRDLEDELTLAVKIQRNLLPAGKPALPGWEIDYHYEPASIVSGDYCDLMVPDETGRYQYIITGDITGKGVAASMLMTHLHAMFHTLVPFNLEVNMIMERVNRLLCESTESNLFATLVFAKANVDGKVELCNAGHCQPILLSSRGFQELETDGIPLGVMYDSVYTTQTIKMETGDILILYTDGLSEAMNGDDCFDFSRIYQYENEFREMAPREIIETILAELSNFLDGIKHTDDLTLMVIKKS